MSGAIGVPSEADAMGKTVVRSSSMPLRYLMLKLHWDGSEARKGRVLEKGAGPGRWSKRGEGLGSEGGTVSSFQNKQQERERLGLGRGEEPRKQAEGRLGLNPAFSTVNWMTLSRVLHLSDCPRKLAGRPLSGVGCSGSPPLEILCVKLSARAPHVVGP